MSKQRMTICTGLGRESPAQGRAVTAGGGARRSVASRSRSRPSYGVKVPSSAHLGDMAIVTRGGRISRLGRWWLHTPDRRARSRARTTRRHAAARLPRRRLPTVRLRGPAWTMFAVTCKSGGTVGYIWSH